MSVKDMSEQRPIPKTLLRLKTPMINIIRDKGVRDLLKAIDLSKIINIDGFDKITTSMVGYDSMMNCHAPFSLLNPRAIVLGPSKKEQLRQRKGYLKSASASVQVI